MDSLFGCVGGYRVLCPLHLCVTRDGLVKVGIVELWCLVLEIEQRV